MASKNNLKAKAIIRTYRRIANFFLFLILNKWSSLENKTQAKFLNKHNPNQNGDEAANYLCQANCPEKNLKSVIFFFNLYPRILGIMQGKVTSKL